MRNRNHTLSQVAVAFFIACASPAVAADPSQTTEKSAKDHDCSLPANIRNKVEHCNQVGDFGGRRVDDLRMESKPGDRTIYSPPSAPGTREGEKKSKKRKKLERDAKKDSMLEIKSDSEPPAKNTK